ncbi:MAG: hypothetical protein ACHQSE_10475 [Gemmatimonadales bacterium]
MRSIAVLALLLLVACDRSPTAPANRLLVTAFATPDSVRAGSSTVVIIGITNVSNTPQTYESNFCGSAYHIFDTAGKRLDPEPFCAAVSLPKTLAPGAQDVYSAEWETTAGSPTSLLPAGTYTIRGAVDGAGVENLPYTVQVLP